jgi:hypothetical protein
LSPFISAFSAIRFFLAFLETRVRLIAHVTTPEAVIRIVEARTIHPPHARCGTNSRISTRNASRVTSSVGNRSMSRPRRYRAECEGE